MDGGLFTEHECGSIRGSYYSSTAGQQGTDSPSQHPPTCNKPASIDVLLFSTLSWRLCRICLESSFAAMVLCCSCWRHLHACHYIHTGHTKPSR